MMKHPPIEHPASALNFDHPPQAPMDAFTRWYEAAHEATTVPNPNAMSLATIDPDGYMQITDRSKDVIKSGGEWISSIDVENIAMAHPAVAMAACIGMKHPKWDERPIIAVVKKPGSTVSRDELIAFYDGKTAKWQIPDDVVFLEAIPLGGTGKMQKTKLREVLKDYTLPGL